jgi:hypothetical protein
MLYNQTKEPEGGREWRRKEGKKEEKRGGGGEEEREEDGKIKKIQEHEKQWRK